MHCRNTPARISVAVLLAVTFVLGACALVPREAVELSSTVGRDVVSVRASHIQLAHTLFDRMKADVNRFVDDVYAPYQIQNTLARQKTSHAAEDPNNIFSVMETAMSRPQDAQAQKDVIEFMQVMVELIHDDVEEYRRIRLEPILEQEREVIETIAQIYDQIERGNAIVTAHLASVVKVHEAQDEVLQAVDLAGLRDKLGVKLSNASSAIADFVNKAEKVEGSIDEAKAKINKLTEKLDSLTEGG